MTVISPCITVETEDGYRQAVERLTSFAERVQIDISDGEFAPNFLIGVDKLYWPQNWTVDVHAMVMRPSEYVQQLVLLKPNLIIFHAEIQEDIVKVLKYIKQCGIKAGVALLRTTVPSAVKEAIEEADHVLIFSGNLGKYGGTASLMQLEKIRLVRTIRPTVEIGWDGGANLENAFSLAQGGVDVLHVGGYINNADDPAVAYKHLTDEINKHGVL